jgi:hypothetical protein
MKILALGLLAAVLMFSACGDDDKTLIDPGTSTFSFDGKTVTTPYGYWINYGVDSCKLLLCDRDLEADTGTKKFNLFALELNLAIVEDTTRIFTYLPKDSDNFNTAQNFHSSAVVYQDTKIIEATTGIVRVTKSGSNYVIDYNVVFGDISVKGNYAGPIRVIPDDPSKDNR